MSLFDRLRSCWRKGSQSSSDPKDAPGNRRVIKTARTVEEINSAARRGFRPLVKPVKPSSHIHSMVAVFQDPVTGEIELSRDLRWHDRGKKMVVDYTCYYPYHFANPFAAYLLPRDLAVGEEVWLADLIEDVLAVWGNQWYHPRLPAASAIWNGSDFEIQFDSIRDAPRWIG